MIIHGNDFQENTENKKTNGNPSKTHQKKKGAKMDVQETRAEIRAKIQAKKQDEVIIKMLDGIQSH